jgi:pimeloyl-ACP methyl ester carboxylesterase
MTIQIPFIYELQKIKCPLSIIYGGKDRIIDADHFVRECSLPKHKIQLVSSLKIEEYEHMDVLWAWNAKDKVFQHILQQLDFILKKERM